MSGFTNPSNVGPADEKEASLQLRGLLGAWLVGHRADVMM